MPTYEYRRPDGTTFEIVQRISEDALTHDPETGDPCAVCNPADYAARGGDPRG